MAVVYVYPIAGDSLHDEQARRFVDTYRQFPGLADHSLHVVFNGASPARLNLAVFEGVPFIQHQHDDSGWDIGAFQFASRAIDCDVMVFLGGSSYFARSGWLRRMLEAYERNGAGLYGASASYEVSPHVRTTGFWSAPAVVRAYPKKVATFQDRYGFEHGRSSLTSCCATAGIKSWMVTWDGIYDQAGWRDPADVFRRGDQSNSLVIDGQFDRYSAMSAADKKRFADLADGKTGG